MSPPAEAFWPAFHVAEELGRPSRKGAAAALAAHVGVLAGKGLKGALAQALADAPGLGGNDRRFVALATRELSRHQRLLDFAAKLAGSPPSRWVLREDQALLRYVWWRRLLTGASAERILVEVRLPGPLRPRSAGDADLLAAANAVLPEAPELDAAEVAPTRHSLPTWLAAAVTREAPSPERTMEALNFEPSLILRARLPGQREARRAELIAAGIAAEVLAGVPDGLILPGTGAKVFDTPAFRRGLLQVQDAGSQLIVEICRPTTGFAGSRVADVCAGAGGKSVALADRVGPEGRVDATDVSAPRLSEARRRARESHVRNVSFPTAPRVGEADVVLVDAPCSGTGNLAREPDLKWKLTAASVERFAERQRALLSSTVEAARPGALIVYATCSLMRVENEDVVAAVVAGRGDLTVEPVGERVPPEAQRGGFLRTWPGSFPGGGFFGARLRKAPRPG